MMLSVDQNIWHQKVRSVNNELESIWKEAVMGWFELLSWHLFEGNEESHKNLIKNNQLPTEIQTSHLSDTVEEYYCFIQFLTKYFLLLLQ